MTLGSILEILIGMKVLLTICLLLVAIQQAGAQSAKQQASLSRSQIKETERRLSDIGYWTGPIDGLLDPATREALIAFQKYSSRNITGELTLDELEAIRGSEQPKARTAVMNMLKSIWIDRCFWW